MQLVIVLGSSNTDMTIRLPHLPGQGQTVLGGKFLTGPGGKGANQAVAARRAGAEVVFLTAVGDDALGRQAIEGYRAEGIDVSQAKIVAGEASGVALIFVGEDGENMIGVAPGANARLTPEDIDRLPDSLFEPGSVLLASLEVPLETVVRALRRARQAGVTTILNPAPCHDDLVRDRATILPLVDVLTPNQQEALALAAPAEGDDAAQALRTQFGARHVVITRGAEGCLVATEQGTLRIPPFPVQVVDTVGAGDAFNGALAVALAEGRSLRDAAVWASAAAALAVTRPGAQEGLPLRPEIDRLAVTRL